MLLSVITGAMTGWSISQIIILYPLPLIHLIAYLLLSIPGIVYLLYLYSYNKKLKKLIEQELFEIEQEIKKLRETHE